MTGYSDLQDFLKVVHNCQHLTIKGLKVALQSTDRQFDFEFWCLYCFSCLRFLCCLHYISVIFVASWLNNLVASWLENFVTSLRKILLHLCRKSRCILCQKILLHLCDYIVLHLRDPYTRKKGWIFEETWKFLYDNLVTSLMTI